MHTEKIKQNELELKKAQASTTSEIKKNYKELISIQSQVSSLEQQLLELKQLATENLPAVSQQSTIKPVKKQKKEKVASDSSSSGEESGSEDSERLSSKPKTSSGKPETGEKSAEEAPKV